MVDAGGTLPAWPDLDLVRAYAVQHAVSAARMARGEVRVGRKVGFTNAAIWDEYAVRAPIWGPVWDRTLHYVYGSGRVLSVSMGDFQARHRRRVRL